MPNCPTLRRSYPTIRSLQATEPDRAAYEIDAVDLTPEALARFRLVDLREPDERAAAPVRGALQLPFSTFDAATLPFTAERPILFVCASGRRSRAAAEQLRALGWDQTYSLIGGAAALRVASQQAAE